MHVLVMNNAGVLFVSLQISVKKKVKNEASCLEDKI